MKRFSFYFISTVVIGFIVYLAMGYQARLERESAIKFSYLTFIMPLTIFPILFGLLLRSPKLILEIKEKKQWSFDWIKFAAIGIPSLYIAAMPILYTSILRDYLLFPRVLLIDSTFITIAGIVFGYVLLDSLKK